MNWTSAQISWRKAILGLAGVLICLYSGAVLWCVLSVSDIGVRCAFTKPVVNRIFPRYLRLDARDATAPQPGDTVAQLGGQNVAIWPQMLRTLIDLEKKPAIVVANLEAAETQGLSYISLENEKLVRVEFARQEEGTATQFTCWFVVGRLPNEELLPSLLWFALSLGLFLVGAIVFWKRPADDSAARFFLLCTVTLGAYMGGYHWAHLVSDPLMLIVFIICGVSLPAVLLYFCLTFPQPKEFIQRRPRRALLAIFGVPLLFLATLTIGYLRVIWLFRHGAPTDDVYAALMLLQKGIYLHLATGGLWYLASVCILIHSYRTAKDGMNRNQVKCILVGALVALGLIVYTLCLAIWNRREFSSGGATWPMFFASLCFTAAFVVSMTRYRLMQLDQLSFYREKYQLDRTLRRMGQAIEQLVDPPTLARRLMQASAELLGVSQASVYLREGTPPLYRLTGHLGAVPALSELSSGCPLVEALLSHGAVTVGQNIDSAARQLRFLGGEAAHALAHEGQVLALLVLGAKESGPYGAEDLNLLAAFAKITALALESAEGHRTIEVLNRDLQAKVVKISEQQRRILALQSQLAEQAVTKDNSASPPGPDGTAPATEEASTGTTGGIIGSSPAARQLLHLVRKVSASQSAVLIRGESGTGKELLAHALHDNSARVGKPFVKVHCAALSPGLLESELFGHVKGAFTGAHKDKVGRFELAHGGTLFLDEIGDITLEVQTKLLRVLQEMTFERVGSSDPMQVNVRLIAATHQDLENLIRQGRFREDLYYRLNVIALEVPPLRERREDIAELAQFFLKQYAQRSGKAVTQIDDDALVVLKAHPWPGNVRQLENVIERAVVVAEGPLVTPRELPADIVQAASSVTKWLSNDVPRAQSKAPALVAVWSDAATDRDRQERELLVRALAAAGGNKAEAARALGVARSTLVSRLKKHGLS